MADKKGIFISNMDKFSNIEIRKNTFPEYVFGISGIQSIFQVSARTAQRYKSTWLAPAITQRGQVFIVDVKLAIELFKANKP